MHRFAATWIELRHASSLRQQLISVLLQLPTQMVAKTFQIQRLMKQWWMALIQVHTTHMESFRVLAHFGAALNWEIKQLDIKTAFLNSVLEPDEICYMEQPKGFIRPGFEDYIWELLCIQNKAGRAHMEQNPSCSVGRLAAQMPQL